MKHGFEFNGDWIFNETFEVFKDSLCFGDYAIEPKYRNHIKITFLDRVDFIPEPSPEQLNTFVFIKSNQEKLLDVLFENTVNVIYPFHKQFVDDEDIFFPILKSKNDLRKVYGLDEIVIHTEHKNKSAYFTFIFNNFSPDGHGQHITFHQKRLIHFDDAYSFEAIINDLEPDDALNAKMLNKISYENLQIQQFIYQKPISKFNKFKPWQIENNDFYPSRLIHYDKIDELKVYIEEILPKIGNEKRQLIYYIHIAETNNKLEIGELLKERLKVL